MGKINWKWIVIFIVIAIIIIAVILLVAKNKKIITTSTTSPVQIGAQRVSDYPITNPVWLTNETQKIAFLNDNRLEILDIKTNEIFRPVYPQDEDNFILVDLKSLNNERYIGDQRENLLTNQQNYEIFDLKEKKPLGILDKNIKDLGLIANNKLYYLYPKGSDNWDIVQSDLDGKNWQMILSIKIKEPNLVPINESTIGYYSSTTDKIYLVDINKKGQSTVNLGGQFEAKNIIFTNGQIGIVKDKKITLLNLSGQTVKTLILPDSFPNNVTNFMLTKDYKTLYFTADDFLYKLSLPN